MRQTRAALERTRHDPQYRLFRQTMAEILATLVKSRPRDVAGPLSPRDGATKGTP